MDHFEMVEKLREKANVTYEEAKAALEACDWDLLDALVFLENEGKLSGEAKYTTEEKKPPVKEQEQKRKRTGGGTRFLESVGRFIRKCTVVTFDVERGGKNIISLPVLVFGLLLIFLFWWTMALLVLGLFFGFRYAFHGMKVFDPVNDAMDKAGAAADNLKQQATGNGDIHNGDGTVE